MNNINITELKYDNDKLHIMINDLIYSNNKLSNKINDLENICKDIQRKYITLVESLNKHNIYICNDTE